MLATPAALEMTGLQTLHYRREKRCLDFAVKCTRHPTNCRIFPLNPNIDKDGKKVRNREPYVVKMSAIPFCQRKLDSHLSLN